jgi:hypothetical protein
MKDVARAMSGIFAVSDESGPYALIPDLLSPQDYVDAIGEPIDSALLPGGGVIYKSSEEAWGIEAARAVRYRIAQARRFREWAMESLH